MTNFPKCWISKAQALTITMPSNNPSNTNTGLVVGIVFSVLIVLSSAGLVAFMYVKRKACFAGRRELQFTRLRFTKDSDLDNSLDLE